MFALELSCERTPRAAGRRVPALEPAVPAASTWRPPALPPLGAVLAERFRLQRRLGEGGMSAVFEAFDEVAGTRLALKVLRPSITERADLLAQLRRELLLARAITHPCVCRLFDLHLHRSLDGAAVPFLTLELLPGETLAKKLQLGGPLAEREALAVVRQVVAGLAAAHAAGVVHSDLKPGNVMLVPEGRGVVRAVLTDFGIAQVRIDGAPAGLRAAAGGPSVEGTPEYMAPEQAGDGPVTPASDIYALGVLLHELVTGRRPDPGPGGSPVVSARLSGPWRAVVEACLHREPARRPREVGEVLRGLEALA